MGIVTQEIFGPTAEANRRSEIEIRGVDQTVVENPVHDLLRPGLSLATAARSSNLTGVTTAVMMEEMIEGYVAHPNKHKDAVLRKISSRSVMGCERLEGAGEATLLPLDFKGAQLKTLYASARS